MSMRSLIPSLWNERGGPNPLRQLQREIDQIFARWPLMGAEGNGLLTPEVDVAETETTLEIMAELPGVDAKDIEITVDNDMLTIKGEKKAEKEETKKDYHLVERSYGSFQRSIPLPPGTEADRIVAKFDKGVLTVSCPKPKTPSGKSRKIPLAA